MNDIAWRLRGPEYARNVHPEALETFNSMPDCGMDLALGAYRTAPDFFPASDAVFSYNLTTKRLGLSEHFEMLDDVLKTIPCA